MAMAHSGTFLDGKTDKACIFSPGSWVPDPRNKYGIAARTSRRKPNVYCKIHKSHQDDSKDSVPKRPRWLSGASVVAGVATAATVGISRLSSSCRGSHIGNGGSGGGGGGGDGGSGNGGPGGNDMQTLRDGPVLELDEEEERKQQKLRPALASLSSKSREIWDDEAVQRFKGQASFDFETNKLNVQLKPEENGEAEKLSSKVKHEVLENEEAHVPKTATSKPLVRRDEEGGGLAWLTGLIDSALVQLGLRKRHKLKADERKELAKEVAELVLQQLRGDASIATKFETATLKRLQQEAFTSIMKGRERLDKVEHGLTELKQYGNEKTTLKARVAAGGAYVLMQDQTSLSSRAALEQCGLPAGLDVDFTFQTPFRDEDMLTTKCVASDGSSSGAIRLQKIHYAAKVTDDIEISFVPFGGHAKDVTETVNPVRDDALTRFSKCGAALFDHCAGSAIGAMYKNSSMFLSISQHISGWGEGSDPVCLSTLAQVLHQPSEHFVFSVSGLNRVWPSPPLPSTPGLHWSEMEPLVFSTSISSISSTSSNISRNSDAQTVAFQPKGTAMQSVAVSGEVKLGNLATLGGWFQVDRGEWIVQDEQKQPQWFLSLAKSSGNVSGGVCMGRSRRDYLSYIKDEETPASQLQVEAFLKLECGQGFWIQPGLLYLINKRCQTPGLMIKAEWKL